MIEPYTADRAGRVWVTPAYYDLIYGRNLRTVRDWARRREVRAFWHNDQMYVHLTDCRKLDAETPKQERKTRHAS